MAKKKFMNLEMQQYYDEKIKEYIATEDAAKLAEAKKYTDEAPFDPAGTAQTKVDELANGAVKENTEAIAKLNGAATEDGSVAKAVKDAVDAAKEELNGAVEAVDVKADKNAEDIGGIKERVSGAEANIEALQETVEEIQRAAYDDTEIRELIEANASGIESLDERTAAAEDKLKVLVGDDAGKSARKIANEELAKQLIAEGAAENLNALEEIAAWIQAHPGDAAAMNAAIEALEELVGTLPEGVSATTIAGYIKEVADAEEALDARVAAIESKFTGTGEGSVADQIADAKAEAVAEAVEQATEAAATDATTKANAAEQNAKDYADGLNEDLSERVEAVEAKAHEHANKAVLDGIDAAKVAAWDAAEDNAKTYADGLNTAMTTKVNGVGSRLTTAEGKLSAVEETAGSNTGRIAALEGLVGDGFEPITAAEIDAMFQLNN